MVIETYCVCGKRVVINEEMAGQDINCIRCGRPVQLVKPKPPEPKPVLQETPAPAVEPASKSPASFRDHVYWAIALLLLPLAVYLGRPDKEDIPQKLERTIASCPPSVQDECRRIWHAVQKGEARLDDLFELLPGRRLLGAALPRHSSDHLLLALAAVAVFWLIVSLSFSPGSAKPGDLVKVGFFTGILGVGLLFILHSWGPTAIFIRLCFLADDAHRPDLFQTWAVYTFGVGLFEEGVKLVPLIWYLSKHRRIGWRLACLWGLASGVGFGISEGIMYSDRMYNGIAGMQAYLVRFASCVALHAIWTASAGISLHRSQDIVRAMMRWDVDDIQASLAFTPDRPLYTYQNKRPADIMGWVLVGLRVLIVVMFLHGLYDAALTRDRYDVALAAAVGSFTWLAWQIETARSKELKQAAVTTAPEAAS